MKPLAPSQHVAVRLDDSVVARIDAIVPHFALPGREGTRSDVLRAVILLGVEAFERDPDGAKRLLMGTGNSGNVAA